MFPFRGKLFRTQTPKIPWSRRIIRNTKPNSQSARRHLSNVPQHPNFIANKFTASKTDTWVPLHDPATDQVISHVPESTDQELQEAIDEAENAFASWKSTSLLKRQQIMFRFSALIRQNWDRLAESITAEQGKTLEDARGDVLRGLQVAETACGITTQMLGSVLEVSKDMETRTYREPLGVTAVICPFSIATTSPAKLSRLTWHCRLPR